MSFLSKLAFFALKYGLELLAWYITKKWKVSDAKEKINEAMAEKKRKDAAAKLNNLFK